ncbi:unnamed protein product [Paramecium primaurelia]|uniref:Transmembrane protein n=2 Tax=Paramecium TaxID=5884 RepID=A0A8S1VCF9_9CILI|nr:unnamed protein product [Paramecium primaurelia]CAD8172566.1 unnamed protein product [Paramecium pentaurelia]
MTQGRVLDCHLQHPGLGCISFALLKFLLTGKRFSIFFIPMHFIPILIFKRKELRSHPFTTIKRASVNCLKSLLFLSSMVGIIRLTICSLKRLKRPLGGIDGLIIGLFSGTSIILESDGRGFEMTLQLFPRFCESIYNHFHKKYPKLKMKNFELILFSLLIGLIHYCYQHNSLVIKSTYLALFKQFWGKN